MNIRRAIVAIVLVLCIGTVSGKDVIRHRNPNAGAQIAQAVEVPAERTLVLLSGVGPDIVDAAAPKDSVAAYGDTKAQTLNVLSKIETVLRSMGLGMKDIVRMQVFLAGDPAQSGAMDFKGMTESYRKFFGTAEQPNLPARSTVKVAGLVYPGWLVEIEVTVVRP